MRTELNGTEGRRFPRTASGMVPLLPLPDPGAIAGGVGSVIWPDWTSESEVTGLEIAFQASAPGGSRTPNLLIRSQMLYPLSYRRSTLKDR